MYAYTHMHGESHLPTERLEGVRTRQGEKSFGFHVVAGTAHGMVMVMVWTSALLIRRPPAAVKI